MLKHPQLTLDRIQQFASGRGLGKLTYTESAPVRLSVYHAPDRISYDQAAQGDYQPAQVGLHLGPFWSTHWFRVEIEIPTAWRGREVHFRWDSTSEATVWDEGRPMQGLAGSGVGWGPPGAVRSEYILTRKAQGGEALVLYVEAAVNNLFGLGVNRDPAELESIGMLRQADIAVFDREAWDLLWDFKVIADMATFLPANTPRGAQALFTANQMVNLIDPADRATWKAARAAAKEFYAASTGEGQLNLSAIGHAHIDTAWLWPLAETRRKCVRTFSTAVRYMEDYPDYKFSCSQAQQLAWMKELQPDLFERIKAKVKSGQFVPVGGAWVEPDCNLPSGESLVRQFLYGQRFFKREFGRICEEFWEPDVFGYSAALPQILRQAGIKYFLTIKLSWNQFNKLSSHTFWWEGLDGSRVLTHFPPADTYNAFGSVKDAAYSVANYKDLDRSKEAYMLFGYGDGGGGPTREMLEQVQRMKDVDGLPRVEYRSANDFFKRLEKDGKDLTTWVGELYFELHRGTYTTQANNKKYNRLSEFMLHDVEFLSALARVRTGLAYPQAELERLWGLVLTSQFHDIIPGSSITLVYEDSNMQYTEVLGSGSEMRNMAVRALFGQPPAHGANILAVNTTGVARSEVVELPDGAATAQTAANGKPLGLVSALPYGYSICTHAATLTPVSDATPTEGFVPSQPKFMPVRLSESDGQVTLENDLVQAVFRQDGVLVSLFDRRAARESIQPGQAGNRFVLYEDLPNNWDAWDVDIFHLEKPFPPFGASSCRVIETGPLRASIAFEYEISPRSKISQVVSLTAVSPRLDFTTEVEWHEQHKFLKVEFPINVRASNATYEVQFGHLQRPTHFNTSWDWARFEVCAHKWADLSDVGFGVALLNDCKYGYAAHGSTLRLSLLRAPTSPDPQADQGHHIFRYALLPHAGPVQNAGVIEEGIRFNQPLLLSPTNAQPEEVSFFHVDNPALILDTVKKAEDSEDLVVRLYESRGTHGAACLRSALPLKTARRCNLLEDEQDGKALEVTEDGLALTFRPFEIITLKLGL